MFKFLYHFYEASYFFLSALYFAVIPRRRPSVKRLAACRIIAHRGAYDNDRIFENTLMAFEKAVNLGVWGIEFDVHWTSDQIPVVIHDPDCVRLFYQNIVVGDTNFKALRAACPLIPTLAEVVQQFGRRIHLMCELKLSEHVSATKQNDTYQEIFAACEPVQDYHFISLEYDLLKIPRYAPTQSRLPIAGVWSQHAADLVIAEKYGGLLGDCGLLRHRVVKRLHALNLPLGTGIVMSKNCFYREVNRRIDWIFTDDPVKICAYAKQNDTN